ncbi:MULTISPECIES: MarR family transcriptional regulator [Paenibacillus]|uniref:MarR family transcriptional regulator n=1 Tax=Paenibacillus agri TaxID=2744309 RepID=A0A850EQ78_9BACL|nr:MarR family transcriptional regulator [Paenibacillus agri]
MGRYILPEQYPEEEQIFELLQSLSKAISPKFERLVNISPTRLRLLHELYDGDEISQSFLQKEVDIDGAAVTRHLKGLEECGMITRRNNPEDNRVTLVSLTEAGRGRIASLCEEKKNFISNLFSSITPEERTALIDMLTRMQQNIKQL